ncbi:MAG: HesA/MoeB/ThiF family protein [Bacteroidales bacterium]
MQQRYNRHHIIEGFGTEGQDRLKNSSALIVGIGGLGSPIALYLAAAGIGRIGIIDDDTVSISNLQRQILYRESEINLSKVERAKHTLEKLNSHITIEAYPLRLDNNNAREIITRYDIVIDGCDNFNTRYIIDQITSELQIPYVYGSIAEFQGQISVFNHKGAGSYNRLFPKEEYLESSADSIGVIGSVPGVVGSLQATEAIKILSGVGEPLINRMLLINLKSMEFKIFSI